MHSTSSEAIGYPWSGASPVSEAPENDPAARCSWWNFRERSGCFTSSIDTVGSTWATAKPNGLLLTNLYSQHFFPVWIPQLAYGLLVQPLGWSYSQPFRLRTVATLSQKLPLTRWAWQEWWSKWWFFVGYVLGWLVGWLDGWLVGDLWSIK